MKTGHGTIYKVSKLHFLRLEEKFNTLSKCVRVLVSPEIATNVECKSKTDVKWNHDKLVSSCDQLIVTNTDCTKIEVLQMTGLIFTIYCTLLLLYSSI